MKWLTGIIFLFVVLVIWCFVDFQLGQYLHSKHWKKRLYPIRKGKLTLITYGPILFQQYFKDLYSAQSNIHVLFYIVKGDQFSSLFFNILMEKAQNGVEVRLLLDRFGSRKVPKELISEARAKGIEVIFSHRIRFPFLFHSLQKRNHRKITIIDGKVGYVGGYNVGKEYIDLDPVLSPWRDYHLRMEGEGVADLQSEFIVDWERATNQLLVKDSSLFPPLKQGPMLHRLLPSEGVGVEEELVHLFAQAKEEITIGTPYFIPTKKLMETLENALQRGVKVTILVPEKSDHPIVKEASLSYLRRIMMNGGTVYEYESGFFHAKVFLVDDTICDIGTANFDYRSILLNHEINCFIYDQTFISQVKTALAEDFRQSNQLTYADLKNVRLTTRIKEWIGKVIERLL